jgi:8-oxo-dGTP pyrophosphatase MutT (NUDIX family)
MRWIVHGEREIYRSDWVRLCLTDVEIPGGERFDHHVVRVPRHASGVVIHDSARGVLMLWRHRFITDSWGWEVPAGMIEAGETPAEAARREAIEEAGWEPAEMRPLCSYHPANGTSDQVFHAFATDGARYVGDPTDTGESERIEWVPVNELRGIIARGEMPDGLTLTAVLAWLLERADAASA